MIKLLSHINPWFLIPPHRISHPDKLIELTEDMIDHGWDYKLKPLIGYTWLNYQIQLLTGSHRVIAARNARLFNIPVLVYPYEIISNAWGNLDEWKNILME
jgi:hypothetical protein